MIRQDTISHMCIVLALAITLYLFTYESTTLVLFPVVLLISGATMELWFERKQEFVDDNITESKTLSRIGAWTGIALAGMLVSGASITYVKSNISMQLTGTGAILYSVLIAISEEQFFRGFITDWLLVRFPNPLLAILSSAAIFMVYHFMRYGTSIDALAYVFAGGFILAFVAYKSRLLSPLMLGHVINNIYALVR